FLRNAIVAKVAGKDSELLQISSDERARVSRVAEMFGEEDLARFLQIMLRTHGELGYKQEQRLHLELGLLKMTHAQRLLPLEQLLSEAAQVGTVPRSTPAAAPLRSIARPERTSATAGSSSADAAPSPFAVDTARKAAGPRSKMEDESGSVAARNSFSASASSAAVVMGAAAPAMAAEAVSEHQPE